MEMISAKFLWGNVLLGGKLQIGAKNSNFEIFESALYMKSVSMPLAYPTNMGHPGSDLHREHINLPCLISPTLTNLIVTLQLHFIPLPYVLVVDTHGVHTSLTKICRD